MFVGVALLAMPLRGLQRLAFGEGACSDPKSPSRDRSSSSHAAGSAAHLGTEISATSASAPLPRALADDRGCAAGAGLAAANADLEVAVTFDEVDEEPNGPHGPPPHMLASAFQSPNRKHHSFTSHRQPQQLRQGPAGSMALLLNPVHQPYTAFYSVDGGGAAERTTGASTGSASHPGSGGSFGNLSTLLEQLKRMKSEEGIAGGSTGGLGGSSGTGRSSRNHSGLAPVSPSAYPGRQAPCKHASVASLAALTAKTLDVNRVLSGILLQQRGILPGDDAVAAAEARQTRRRALHAPGLSDPDPAAGGSSLQAPQPQHRGERVSGQSSSLLSRQPSASLVLPRLSNGSSSGLLRESSRDAGSGGAGIESPRLSGGSAATATDSPRSQLDLLRRLPSRLTPPIVRLPSNRMSQSLPPFGPAVAPPSPCSHGSITSQSSCQVQLQELLDTEWNGSRVGSASSCVEPVSSPAGMLHAPRTPIGGGAGQGLPLLSTAGQALPALQHTNSLVGRKKEARPLS